MTINKKLYGVLLTCLFLTFFLATRVSAQEIKKIAVMPFEIYSKSDNTTIRKTLFQKLTEELKKEKLVYVLPTDELLARTEKLTEKNAIATGKSLGADFIIMGSVTQFGEAISIDTSSCFTLCLRARKRIIRYWTNSN